MNPENIDLTPYAKFGSGWWKCQLCREHGDRFHMLYHLHRKHDIKDIPLMPDMLGIREIFIKCNSKASVERELLPDSWQIRRNQYYKGGWWPDMFTDSGEKLLPNGPYIVPESCRYTIRSHAVSKAEFIKFQEDNK